MKNIFCLICFCFITITCYAQTDTLRLKAIKTYKPTSQSIDDDTTLSIPTKFKIPKELPVISGSSGSHKATLQYRFGNGKIITITYKGNKDNEGNKGKKIKNGSAYIFEKSSEKNLHPGTLVKADYLKLSIDNGDSKAGTTVVLLPLAINNEYGLTKCSSGGSVNFWFNSDNQMNNVVWSWTGGSITATLIPGPSGGTYIYGSTATSPTYNGPYTVTVQYTSGATFTRTLSSIFESVATSPTITVLATPNPICNGATVSLTGNGAGTGGTYTWTATNGFTGSGANVTNNPNVNTTYTVKGTSSNGCYKSASMLVNVNQVPISITVGGGSCPGNTTTLTASGATSYVWSGPSIVGPDNTAT
ncbi:MAG: hypothetical protein K2X86_08665, partial [Cytophagaceae bacterium]|nr:hypothetical protein [Cytophagaceae bacterium]